MELINTDIGQLKALVDSGSEANFVNAEFIEKNGLTSRVRTDNHVKARVANGETLDILGKMVIKVNNHPTEFYVAKIKTRVDIILDFLG